MSAPRVGCLHPRLWAPQTKLPRPLVGGYGACCRGAATSAALDRLHVRARTHARIFAADLDVGFYLVWLDPSTPRYGCMHVHLAWDGCIYNRVEKCIACALAWLEPPASCIWTHLISFNFVDMHVHRAWDDCGSPKPHRHAPFWRGTLTVCSPARRRVLHASAGGACAAQRLHSL